MRSCPLQAQGWLLCCCLQAGARWSRSTSGQQRATGSGLQTMGVVWAPRTCRAPWLRQRSSASTVPCGAKRSRPHPQGTGNPPRLSHVPSLSSMALRAAVALLTAPRKQYCSGLASLTPPLAERLLAHMIRHRLLRPKTLELFFGCPIQSLVLSCYPYATNELLRQVQAFQSLRHLSLVSCPLLTDQGLSVVRHLRRLQHLNLSACVKLTDTCLRFLKGLPHLSHLALDQTKISDSGMADFLHSAPSALTHLSLNRTGITDRTLRLLPQYAPGLVLLSLKQTEILDFSALQQLSRLHTLHLDDTRVSQASLAALASHPALSTLTLSGVQSVDGDQALQLVSGLPLAQLSLPCRHTVTDSGLHFLCRLEGLLELDLTDFTHITDEGLRHLPQLHRLRRLSLCNTLVTDCGLQHLQGLRHLEELCLDRTAVSSAGVARCITRLPLLQVLGLASTPVGDSVVRMGVSRCKQLLKVNLSRTRVTDRGLRFLRQVPIAQVNLDGSGVTAAGVASLLAACPSIVSIRASHLQTLSPEQLSDEELPS
nr:F-box/LRR-repeat protein 2-like isoform X2 [Caretta caretta]